MKHNYLRIAILILVMSFFTFEKANAQSNQYLDFDGVDDWVSAPNGSQLIANGNAFSISGWFFNSALSYGKGMMGFRSSTQGFYLIELNNGTIECRFINSANTMAQVVAPANTIIPNMWQHYAWVYNGSSVKLYLNGTLVGSANASGTITLSNIAFSFGKSPIGTYNFYYKGKIDEVSVWNKALTPAEIQSMMQDELIGTETGLQLYFKVNQGVPGGSNQSITKLITEINSPLYDADLIGFAMTGATSNFNGTLDTSFQAISFPQIPTKLTNSPAFKLSASATSGLPVGFTLISGPATISNDSCFITGAGTVKIEAFQNGNSQYDTAVSVINTFDVVSPALNLPIIDARNPLPGVVRMPSLAKIQLAAYASINYKPLFSVQELHFRVNGVTINTTDFNNGHYTAWWQPANYGSFPIEIIATSNMGAIATTIVNIDVVQSGLDTVFQAFSGVLLNTDANTQTVYGNLPSYLGAYDSIFATLVVTCPPGGCGEWDRIASIDVKSPEGNWFEIIRYITPYGKACSHKVNLTDYMSLLQGKVAFRVNCGTTDNGYLYALNFDFKEGIPAHKYSQVTKIWKKSYPFGDFINLQPVVDVVYPFPIGAMTSKLKLVSTGHGWGDLNTANAAEFYDATHNIWINGAKTFTQHNWTTCNPNPDGCMPQNGTWQYNRAGWCPGSIAKPFDYDLTQYISGGNIGLKYTFYEQYLDNCHPNNPSCVTGSTCTNCSDGFNPFFDVNCNLVSHFDMPPPPPVLIGIDEPNQEVNVAVYPNPSEGVFYLSSNIVIDKSCIVEVFNGVGALVSRFNWNGETSLINLSELSAGVYILKVNSSKGALTKKLIIR